MKLKEKVNSFLTQKGSSQPDLAQKLGLNYQSMNRNIAAGKLTMDVAQGLCDLYPDLDMNWLFRGNVNSPVLCEPSTIYGRSPEDIARQIEELAKELNEVLSQK